MLIRDIMTKAVKVVGPGATVREAAQVMRQFDVDALLVRQGETLVGILTDQDIVARSCAEGRDPTAHRVADVMTLDVAHVCEDQDVQEAAWLMEIKQVRRLAVFGSGTEQLVGIITLDDISLRGEDRELSGEVLEFLAARKRAPEPDLHALDERPAEGWTFSRL
jgi:CBS domain-containing protein